MCLIFHWLNTQQRTQSTLDSIQEYKTVYVNILPVNRSVLTYKRDAKFMDICVIIKRLLLLQELCSTPWHLRVFYLYEVMKSQIM